MLSVKGSKALKSSAAVIVNPNIKFMFHVTFLLFAFSEKCDILSDLYSQYEI